MTVLTYSTNFVCDETGFSSWVHVSSSKGFTEDDYAVHGGYSNTEASAEDNALSEAQKLSKILGFAGVKSQIKKGKNNV